MKIDEISSPIEISNWLEENKVCIVTNSTMRPGSLFVHSLKCYIDYIPENCFMIIPGMKENGKPNYGLSAYTEMINILLSNQYKNVFDYVIYIDEDCFIKNFKLLLLEFIKFKNGNYCLGGLPDGGMICHRNQSRILVNTFLSFWNIKAIRENLYSYINIFNVLMYVQKPYENFINELKKNHKLYDEIDVLSKEILSKCLLYRTKNFKSELSYVKNMKDMSNNYESNQIPYSFNDIIGRNFEPYYLIEETIILSTSLPIYYLFGTDLYINENTNIDNSGMTTVIMDSELSKHIAYHTWCAHKYKPFNTNIQNIKKHVDRINSVIDFINVSLNNDKNDNLS